MELTAIITVDMLPEIFLELLCKPIQSHLDELATLADGNFGLRGRFFGERRLSIKLLAKMTGNLLQILLGLVLLGRMSHLLINDIFEYFEGLSDLQAF